MVMQRAMALAGLAMLIVSGVWAQDTPQPSNAGQDDVKAAFDAIAAAWGTLEGIRADISVDYYNEDPAAGKPSAQGWFAYQKGEAEGKYRMEMTSDETGQKTLRRITTFEYTDATATYRVWQQGEEAMAGKFPAYTLEGLPPGGPRLLAFLDKNFTFKRDPDELFDGRPSFRLSGRAKQDAKVAAAECRLRFDKQTGLCLKAEMGREEYGPYSVYHFSSIEINPDFSADYFCFTPPENVDVADYTKSDASGIPTVIRDVQPLPPTALRLSGE